MSRARSAEQPSVAAAAHRGVASGILRALAASLRAKGSGASPAPRRAASPSDGADPSVRQRRPILLGALVVALLLLPAAPAMAGSVTVSLSGEGTGTVTGSPGSIDCSNTGGGPAGPTCSHNFGFVQATVTLSAVADEPFAFVGWDGGASGPASACTGTLEPCTFNVGFIDAVAVTARFGEVPDPPIVATDSATAVGDHGAVMRGRVNPNGSALDECYFEYGVTTDYGAIADCDPDPAGIGSGTDDVSVSAQTLRLEAGTTYHFRLVAGNFGGTPRGADRTFATTGSPVCPNADIRHAQGIATVLLPDCMALEHVSDVAKANQRARWPHVSRDGNRILYGLQVPLPTAPGFRRAVGDGAIAERGATGWTTHPTQMPAGEPWNIVGGANDLGAPVNLTPDFSRWTVSGATRQQSEAGSHRIFSGALGGSFAPVSPLLVPINRTGVEQIVQQRGILAASADLSRVYFSPGNWAYTGTTATPLPDTAYLPGDPTPHPAAAVEPNTYLAYLDSDGEPALELLARDAADRAWGENCGTLLGGPSGGNTARFQGAVARDGARAFFTTRPNQAAGTPCDTSNRLRIMERVETAAGPEITELGESECERVAPSCATTDGDDRFQGASVDQRRLYFTTNRQLASSDLDAGAGCAGNAGNIGCDLYLHDAARPAGERLVQVSAGEDVPGAHDAGDGARVFDGTTAISGDGRRVYFVAAGVLTAGENPVGDTAVDGQPNLYLWDYETGSTAFIGTLAPGAANDQGGLWGGNGSFRNRAYPAPATGSDGQGNEIGGSGHILVFQSSASLTADDVDGGFRDIYRYDALEGTLELLSVPGPGGSDGGPFDAGIDTTFNGGGLNSGIDFAETGRWVSEDGETVVFITAEPLLPGVSGVGDHSYVLRGGDLARLPQTRHVVDVAGGLRDRPRLSHDGSVVAFQTYASLLPSDGDTAIDVYAARVGGGFPMPPASPDCHGDACQGRGADGISAAPRTDTAADGGNAARHARKRIHVAVPGSIAARRRMARSGVLVLRVGSNRPGVVRVLARGRIGKRARLLGRTSVRPGTAGTARVRLRLRPLARRVLRSGRALRLTVQVRSPGARPRTATVRLERGMS